MKFKKSFIGLIALCTTFMLLIAGCSSAPPQNQNSNGQNLVEVEEGPGYIQVEDPYAQAAGWSIKIIANEQEFIVASTDCAALAEQNIEMALTNKNGESVTNTYTGYKLKDVLALVGAEPTDSIEAIAADGFSSEIPVDIAIADDTLLSYKLDGAPYESAQPVRLSPKSGAGNQFIKDLAQIIVN